MKVQNSIKRKLTEFFAPKRLVVIDESALHSGHVGARPEGETHFRIEIVSERFEGLTLVARQRLVYDALRDDMGTDIHALALKTISPSESESGH